MYNTMVKNALLGLAAVAGLANAQFDNGDGRIMTRSRVKWMNLAMRNNVTTPQSLFQSVRRFVIGVEKAADSTKRPDLHAPLMSVSINNASYVTPGYIFVTPVSAEQGGPYIYDGAGVWLSNHNTNLH
jgi:hypothetical protein